MGISLISSLWCGGCRGALPFFFPCVSPLGVFYYLSSSGLGISSIWGSGGCFFVAAAMRVLWTLCWWMLSLLKPGVCVFCQDIAQCSLTCLCDPMFILTSLEDTVHVWKILAFEWGYGEGRFPLVKKSGWITTLCLCSCFWGSPLSTSWTRRDPGPVLVSGAWAVTPGQFWSSSSAARAWGQQPKRHHLQGLSHVLLWAPSSAGSVGSLGGTALPQHLLKFVEGFCWTQKPWARWWGDGCVLGLRPSN